MGNCNMYTVSIPVIATLIVSSLAANVAATQPTPTPTRMRSGSSMKADPLMNAVAVLDDNQIFTYTGTHVLGGVNRTMTFILDLSDPNNLVYDFVIRGFERYQCKDISFDGYALPDPKKILIQPMQTDFCIDLSLQEADPEQGHSVYFIENITLQYEEEELGVGSYITITAHSMGEKSISMIMNFERAGPVPTTTPAPTHKVYPSGKYIIDSEDSDYDGDLNLQMDFNSSVKFDIEFVEDVNVNFVFNVNGTDVRCQNENLITPKFDFPDIVFYFPEFSDPNDCFAHLEITLYERVSYDAYVDSLAIYYTSKLDNSTGFIIMKKSPDSSSTALTVTQIIGISASCVVTGAIVTGLGFWWWKRNQGAPANANREHLLEPDCSA